MCVAAQQKRGPGQATSRSALTVCTFARDLIQPPVCPRPISPSFLVVQFPKLRRAAQVKCDRENRADRIERPLIYNLPVPEQIFGAVCRLPRLALPRVGSSPLVRRVHPSTVYTYQLYSPIGLELELLERPLKIPSS